MKARVDSGEFSKAIKVAKRYTSSQATDVTQLVLLMVSGDNLELRTTTYASNCIATVNAFSTEDGAVTTMCNKLAALSVDTGELFDLFLSGKKLILDYGDNRVELETTDRTLDDYPVWVETDLVATVDRNILNAAVSNTRPMAEAGMPIKASVHFIPKPEGIYILAHDGFQGVLATVDGVLTNPVSIEGEALARALSVIEGMVNVGIKDSHITVSGKTSPYKISSTTVTSPDPSNLVGGFHLPTTEDVMVINRDELLGIASWCKRATNIDIGSQVLLHTDKGLLHYYIKGQGVNIDGRLPVEGKVIESIFNCKLFSSISEMRESEEYTVMAALDDSDKRGQFWYIDGLDKHSLWCMRSNLFD